MDKHSLTSRNCGLSYSRAIATVAIIALHTGFALSTAWKLNVTANVISRLAVNFSMWAVPVFIMVTGILNLNPAKDMTLEKLFKKNILRILTAMVVFIAIYQVVDMAVTGVTPSLGQLVTYLKNLYSGKTYSPMWYMYMLLGLYLLMPLYRSFTKAGTDRELRFVIWVYIVFISVLPLLGSFGMTSGFYIHELTIYPCYLFIGYALNKGIFKVDKAKGTLFFVVTTVAIGILTYLRWTKGYAKLEPFWGYSSTLVILQSVGIFSMMMGNQWIKDRKAAVEERRGRHRENLLLLKIDDCSFGIYLVHIIFIRIFSGSQWITSMINHITIIPALLVLIVLNLICSYIVVRLLKKVPVFKFFLR